MDPFYNLCFMLVFFILSRLVHATLWPDTGIGLTPGLVYVMFSCGFVTFQYGVLAQLFFLECIDS